MKIINLSVFVCILLLAGCGKKNSSNNNGDSKVVIQENDIVKVTDLSDKSTSDILKLKYDKAVLNCSLWSQNSKNINLNIAPNDSVFLDLKKDTEFPQVLEMSTSIQNHQIKVTLEVTELSHNINLNHTDSQGNIITTQYSPFVKINYSNVSHTFFNDKVNTSGGGSAARIIYERIQDIPLNQSSNVQLVEDNGVFIDNGPINDYVKCTIDTEIKSEFSNQFELKSANK